jgi:hypothetical protein
MVFERKSAVSRPNTWFWRKSPLSVNRRRSRSLNRKTESSSRLHSQPIGVKSTIPGNAWLNFLGSRRNKTGTRSSTIETGEKPRTDINRQSSATAHNWLSFLGSRRNKTGIRSSTIETGKKPRTDINRQSSATVHNWLSFLDSRRNKRGTRSSTIETGKKPRTDINRQSNATVHRMSNTGNMPVWLLRMYTVNRYSSVSALLLVVATLIVYGWTVYSQELWSDYYIKLKSLQRHERQLNTANATLTSKMAQEAEKPGMKFVSPTSERTIFLPSTSNNYPNSSFSTSQPEVQPEPPSPLGY